MKRHLNKRAKKVLRVKKIIEFWKKCDFFEEDFVLCSTLGNVAVNGVVQKGTVNAKGYRLITAENQQHYVHQIMSYTYYGEKPEPNMLIRHLNGNSLDNRKCNLKYGTYKENVQDSIKHGTHITVTRRAKNAKKNN